MSGHGAPDQQPVDCSDLRVAVVAASWHTQVMDGLLAGTERALADYSVADAEIVRVPGTFELPVVAAALAAKGYDAVIALGVVIRGGTPHFDFVCNAATDGLTRVALDHQVAVGFGVLTCDTEQQAIDRAGLEGFEGGQGLRGDLGCPVDREDPGGDQRAAAAVTGSEAAATTDSTVTHVALRAALPDNASTMLPSVTMLVFTPPSGPPQPWGMLTTPGRISSLSSAGSSMTPTLDRTETCWPSWSPRVAASSGCTSTVQRRLPLLMAGTRLSHELLLRRCRRPISCRS